MEHNWTIESTLYSSARESPTKTDYILGQKTNLKALNRIEIIRSMFSDLNGIKLEVNKKERTWKSQNTLKSNKTLLSNPWVEEEVSREIIKYWEIRKY